MVTYSHVVFKLKILNITTLYWITLTTGLHNSIIYFFRKM